jgi:hypothetical protein
MKGNLTKARAKIMDEISTKEQRNDNCFLKIVIL